jgi:hypothetical protein
MKWAWHSRMHWELRVQSDLAAEDRADAAMAAMMLAQSQAQIAALQEALDAG